MASGKLAEVVDGVLQPLGERHLGLPGEPGPGERDVGLALLRIVLRQGQVDDPGARTGELQHLLCQFQHGELARVPPRIAIFKCRTRAGSNSRKAMLEQTRSAGHHFPDGEPASWAKRGQGGQVLG